MLSCSQYDDIAVWNKSVDLEARVSELERLCGELNANITSLQIIVNAINDGDYITSVAPVVVNGSELGYVITFAKSGSITLFHGQNGSDADIPIIGVRKDVDGIYYWTLNGDWLTDDAGNKIRAEGKDGPELRITDGYWEVSYDSGVTWTRLGKATGEDGKDGESYFADVRDEDGKLVIVLKDSTVLEIPYGTSLSINFPQTKNIPIVVGKTVTLDYEVKGYGSSYEIEVLCYDGWDAKVMSQVASTGKLVVSCPADETERRKVVVFVSSEDGTTKMETLTFKYDYVQGNNYLIYFSTDGKVITPYATDVFGAKILSNKYDGYGLITFDAEVTSIGTKAFYQKSTLKEIRLPDSVTSIGNSAFYSCTGLAGSLNLPPDLTLIDDMAYSGCKGFEGDLIIPEPVMKIGASAFSGCTGFEGILVINSNVTQIGDKAFAAPVSGSTHVKLNFSKIYCKASTPPTIREIGSSSMEMSGHYFTTYYGTFGYSFPDYLAVPVGSKSAYKAAKGWKAFTTIEEVEF